MHKLQGEFIASTLSMRSITTQVFEWTSRYGEFLDSEIRPYLQQESFSFCARSFVQYQALKESLLDIQCFECISKADCTIPASSNGGCCSICLEPFGHCADLVVTKCRHGFHSSCLLKLLDHADCDPSVPVTCPLCRSPNPCLDTRRDRAIIRPTSAPRSAATSPSCITSSSASACSPTRRPPSPPSPASRESMRRRSWT